MALPFGLRRGELRVEAWRTAILFPCGHPLVLGLPLRDAMAITGVGAAGRCPHCLADHDSARALENRWPRRFENLWRRN